MSLAGGESALGLPGKTRLRWSRDQRSVGVGLVIALENIVESNGGAVVARDSEANGIWAIAAGKAWARAAGVADIAERL